MRQMQPDMLVSIAHTSPLHTTEGVMTVGNAVRVADLSWQVLSPVIHGRAAHIAFLVVDSTVRTGTRIPAKGWVALPCNSLERSTAS
jgi:hypothetical protein